MCPVSSALAATEIWKCILPTVQCIWESSTNILQSDKEKFTVNIILFSIAWVTELVPYSDPSIPFPSHLTQFLCVIVMCPNSCKITILSILFPRLCSSKGETPHSTNTMLKAIVTFMWHWKECLEDLIRILTIIQNKKPPGQEVSDLHLPSK